MTKRTNAIAAQKNTPNKNTNVNDRVEKAHGGRSATKVEYVKNPRTQKERYRKRWDSILKKIAELAIMTGYPFLVMSKIPYGNRRHGITEIFHNLDPMEENALEDFVGDSFIQLYSRSQYTNVFGPGDYERGLNDPSRNTGKREPQKGGRPRKLDEEEELPLVEIADENNFKEWLRRKKYKTVTGPQIDQPAEIQPLATLTETAPTSDYSYYESQFLQEFSRNNEIASLSTLDVTDYGEGIHVTSTTEAVITGKDLIMKCRKYMLNSTLDAVKNMSKIQQDFANLCVSGRSKPNVAVPPPMPIEPVESTSIEKDLEAIFGNTVISDFLKMDEEWFQNGLYQ